MNSTRYAATYRPQQANRDAARFARAIHQTQAAKLGISLEEFCAAIPQAQARGITVGDFLAYRKDMEDEARETTRRDMEARELAGPEKEAPV